MPLAETPVDHEVLAEERRDDHPTALTEQDGGEVSLGRSSKVSERDRRCASSPAA